MEPSSLPGTLELQGGPMGARCSAVLVGLLAVCGVASSLRSQARVEVMPSQQVLVGGEACVFRVRTVGLEAAAVTWTLLEPQGSTVQQASGSYRAPLLPEVSRFRLRASSLDDPGVFAEAAITVLPRSPFERPVCGGSAGVTDLFPFLVPGSSRRFGANQMVRPWFPPRPQSPSRRIILGYNLPMTIHWDCLAGAEAELLSYREGDELRCQDVTGQDSITLCLRGRVSNGLLEALRHGRGACAGWKSHLRHLSLGVRGMVPFAGDPAAAAGGEDGPGLAARFREPVGLAVLGGSLHCPTRLVVADAASHRIRLLSREGLVERGWGQDGERGYRDGSPALARFDQPTYVAANRWFEHYQAYQCGYGFVLSDSGNHVIRKVDESGWVTTLAGTPGQAGYRDADDPGQAAFSQPQGLVMDAQGDVFVADQGNHVIRRIARTGQVSTLAGAAGESGSQDGRGRQARFGLLTGLTEAGDGQLYVLDGHALRRVSKDGEVTTVLGVADRPGFQDGWRGGTAALAGVPCLRGASSVCAVWKRLYLADQDNHAVREFDLEAGTLRTLVGDPAVAQTRCGLLRDGCTGPLAPAYAGVAAPRGVAVCEEGDVYVATGPGLVRICSQRLSADVLSQPVLRVDRPSVGCGETLAVSFWVPTQPAATGEYRSIQFVLEFINEDGSLAERQERSGLGAQFRVCQGAFSKPGQGTVRLRCVTDQGCSLEAQQAVRVH